MLPPNRPERKSFQTLTNNEQYHHPLNVSEYQSVPSSAGSGPFSYHPSNVGHFFIPQAHLNNGNIVFGGYSESTTPSPAPTQYMVDMQHYYPLFSAQMDNKYSTQHEIDPYMLQQMYVPLNGGAPMSHPNYFSRYDPNFPPTEQRNDSARPRERNMSFDAFGGYPQTDAGIAMHGHGSPTLGDYDQVGQETSQNGNVSSTSERNDPIVREDGQHPLRISKEQSELAMEQPMLSFHQQPQSEIGTRVISYEQESLLQAHLLSYFDNQEFADCILEMRHVNGRFETISIPAHRILLSRSPFLKSRLEVTQEASSTNIVRVETGDRFLTIWAVSRVLHYLYGAVIHDTFDGFALFGKPFNNTTETVDGILATAAAGNLFQLSHIVEEAVRMVSEIVTWENVERILAFSIEGGCDEEWVRLNDFNQKGRHTLEALAKNAGMDHNSTPGSPDITIPSMEKPNPVYGAYAERLLNTALRFIIENFPRNFVFDPSVPSSPSVLYPRLPEQTDDHQQQRSTRPDPRLSSMRFGDYPSEDDDVQLQSTDSSSAVLSQLLVSLPFPLVKRILESKDLGGMNPVAPGSVEKIARSVIYEREQRRRKILKTSTVSYEDRLKKINDWEVVGWEEYVMKMNNDREEFIRLERNWRGIQSPAPSAARPRTKQTKK